MLTPVKMALAGSVMLACALPASANAQGFYYDSYAPAYDYSYTYSDPYAWGPTPFWPINAAAGLIGAATGAIAAPFVGWRDGYFIDERIDPVGYPYGYGGYYRETPRYAYGRAPYWGGGWRGWNGYVATYHGKVHRKHQAMRHTSRHQVRHVATRTKLHAHKRIAHR